MRVGGGLFEGGADALELLGLSEDEAELRQGDGGIVRRQAGAGFVQARALRRDGARVGVIYCS